ncbi:metalloregulator ArsR/SmtB family transcription factor [Nostocaceae cyanobacterium CENA369]|uniref:Metalloregulator ArsR/SmtB family transcription factor n=1 Tax=Dendronalium phyllosphericum CENA369 TaxID=1725256 RepID=A0A8J7I296_9NOST|nr:metalloregulator ArsR/SmtB family transcription factor [Dendronalium phyllosphericum]MBH8572703.1 metalloregulator ArsR/SmtB family transcription factor [Dendronalium phyllosphericum CENA369]
MKREQFQTLLQFFKVLADESRLKIVGILANQECSVEELAALMQLKEPTVSHHLAKLKELNLVTMRPEGNSRLYQLDSEALQSISKEIFTPEKIASLIEDVDTEAWESKVLNNYLEGDINSLEKVQRLKEIPASRKKRLVILKWLASKFDTGVQYPERTVNEILKCYHPDCATLRRELIGYQLMERENGVYWRMTE